MKPEIPEFISISAAGIWAHLLLLRIALEYYNVSRQYDVILKRIDSPVFLASFLCVVAFLLHVLARISSRRWGWGLVINLLLVPLPAWAVYDRALGVLAEQRSSIRSTSQLPTPTPRQLPPLPTLVPDVVEQWDVYTDSVLRYSIEHPADWKVEVREEVLGNERHQYLLWVDPIAQQKIDPTNLHVERGVMITLRTETWAHEDTSVASLKGLFENLFDDSGDPNAVSETREASIGDLVGVWDTFIAAGDRTETFVFLRSVGGKMLIFRVEMVIFNLAALPETYIEHYMTTFSHMLNTLDFQSSR